MTPRVAVPSPGIILNGTWQDALVAFVREHGRNHYRPEAPLYGGYLDQPIYQAGSGTFTVWRAIGWANTRADDAL